MSDTLRSCIVAESGHTFLSLDANQIELRVLAILSQDPKLLEDLRTGDLHQATADRMFGEVEDEEQRKKKRYNAKQANFALVYGADEYKLSEMLECSVEDATQFMSEHKATYPVLYQWMEERKIQAKEDGYVINMFGRIRPLPELYAGSFRMREAAEREVVNTIVQGTAVDIVKLMMLELRKEFDPRVRLVLQVHDEILWEVPDKLIPQCLEQSKVLGVVFEDYPCTVAVGKVYGEMKELEL